MYVSLLSWDPSEGQQTMFSKVVCKQMHLHDTCMTPFATDLVAVCPSVAEVCHGPGPTQHSCWVDYLSLLYVHVSTLLGPT